MWDNYGDSVTGEQTYICKMLVSCIDAFDDFPKRKKCFGIIISEIGYCRFIAYFSQTVSKRSANFLNPVSFIPIPHLSFNVYFPAFRPGKA